MIPRKVNPIAIAPRQYDEGGGAIGFHGHKGLVVQGLRARLGGIERGKGQAKTMDYNYYNPLTLLHLGY